MNYDDKLASLYCKHPCPNALIKDGPVSDEYLGVGKGNKILWVLRETNRELPEYNNDLRELLKACAKNNGKLPENLRKTWKRTYGLVVKVSHGLLNNNEWVENVDSIRSVLKKIAVINIDKRPGGNSFSHTKLKEARREFGDIIDTQINLLKPDVIILGGTGDYVSDDIKRRGPIEMFHPGQRTMTHEKYYEGLLKKKKELKP